MDRKNPEFSIGTARSATSRAWSRTSPELALGRESLGRIKALDLAALPLVQGGPRIGAPVGVVPKFLGIGLNYRDHAEETGMPIPEVPIVFAKASSCVSGPNDPVTAPPDFERMDFEVELGVIIGERAKRVQ